MRLDRLRLPSHMEIGILFFFFLNNTDILTLLGIEDMAKHWSATPPRCRSLMFFLSPLSLHYYKERIIRSIWLHLHSAWVATSKEHLAVADSVRNLACSSPLSLYTYFWWQSFIWLDRLCLVWISPWAACVCTMDFWHKMMPYICTLTPLMRWYMFVQTLGHKRFLLNDIQF